MSDARWSDVRDDIGIAVRHFANAVRLFEIGRFDGDDFESYRDGMALMHAMQSGHTAMEAALKRIFGILNEDLPTGDDWHAQMLRRASRPLDGGIGARPPILPKSLAEAADLSRRFRHRASRGYDDFDARLAAPSIEAARVLAADLADAVEAFRRQVDSPDM